MSILNQKTILKPIIFRGVGLHSGKEVEMKILPSEPNTGIVFKRVDLKSNNLVIPNIFNVSNATLCTTITNKYGAKVSTIEHLMAAMYGLGIDNATIEINSEEVPILDGSAKKFVESFLSTGFTNSNFPIKIIKIEKEVIVKEGEKTISINKSKVSLDIDFEIKYNNQVISNQRNIVSVYQDDLSEVYNSRTFCLYEDIENLKRNGFGKGGSLDNAVVVDDQKVLNEGGLRNELEFVNHKILDCMGDLYLAGYKIIGHVICSQGGHSLTNKLLRKVFEDKANFSIFELKEKNLPHTFINKRELKSIA
tara:strand:+ start:540 stop:1460 length:921 start_codon:yes stop_codon:yes gene_type:complete